MEARFNYRNSKKYQFNVRPPFLFIITSSLDSSTNKVIQWANTFAIECIRINVDTPFIIKGMLSKGLQILESGQPYALWIRTNFGPIDIVKAKTESEKVLFKGLQNEALCSYLFLIFENAKIILGPQNRINEYIIKARAIKLAKEVGLLVPNSTFVYTKEKLTSFLQENNRIITKNASDVLSIKSVGSNLKTFTREIKKEEISDLPEEFGLSFVQKYIEKLLEVKMIFIDGDIYNCGIYINKNSVIDFRTQYSANIIRYFPVNVSEEVMNKVRLLMRKVNLTFGVVDFLVDCEGCFYFMEINPYGQFEALSNACNYHCEKRIAEWTQKSLMER